MTTHTTATVVNGQLQLDQPIALPDQSRVAITVELQENDVERRKKALESWLKLVQEHPISSGGVRFTREELHERR